MVYDYTAMIIMFYIGIFLIISFSNKMSPQRATVDTE